MTTDELRDWHAREAGWEPKEVHAPANESAWGTHPSTGTYWTLGGKMQWDHPYPPTLDGAASAMLEGWSVKIVIHDGVVQGIAWPSKLGPLRSPVNIRPSFFYENECEQNVRFMLAKLAKEAMNANPR